MFNGNSALRAWVPEGNRIKFDSSLDPKSMISSADTPEVSLITESTVATIKSTSTSSMIQKNYSWIIATGDYDVDLIFNQVSWELLRVMASWDTDLCDLKWLGKHFVTETRLLSSVEGTGLTDENKSIRGWALTWPFQVDMHFVTETLRSS